MNQVRNQNIPTTALKSCSKPKVVQKIIPRKNLYLFTFGIPCSHNKRQSIHDIHNNTPVPPLLIIVMAPLLGQMPVLVMFGLYFVGGLLRRRFGPPQQPHHLIFDTVMRPNCRLPDGGGGVQLARRHTGHFEHIFFLRVAFAHSYRIDYIQLLRFTLHEQRSSRKGGYTHQLYFLSYSPEYVCV